MSDRPVTTGAGAATRGFRVSAAAVLQQLQPPILLGTAALYSAGYTSIGLAAMLFAILATAVATRRLPWRRSALDVYLLAFVGVFIVSGLLSAYRSVATGSAVLAALMIYLSYGPLYRTAQDDHRFVVPFLWIWFAGGVAAAAVAGYLFVVHHTPQAALPELGPNGLGSTFLIALVLGAGLGLTTRSPLRFVAAGGVLVVAVLLALTTSRGAWLGATSGLVVLFLLSWHRKWAVVLLTLAAVVVSLALMGGESAVLKKKVLSIFNLTKNERRIFLAKSALAIARDHPLVGSGLNTFALMRPQFSGPDDPYASKPAARVQPYAHNVFLNMAAEGGLLGLGAFLAMLIRGWIAGWRWWTSSVGADRAISATVLAASVGLLVHQQFDGTVLSVHIGAGLWFLLAIMMVNEPPRRTEGPPVVSGVFPVVLAVDPGRGKCGMAVLDGSRVLARRVVPIEELVATAGLWVRDFGANTIVLGNRTAADRVRALLAAALPLVKIVMVDEAGTTEAARRRYFAEHPPRGWRRLVPLGMQTPPGPYDDYVAILLGERFLGVSGTPPRGAWK